MRVINAIHTNSFNSFKIYTWRVDQVEVKDGDYILATNRGSTALVRAVSDPYYAPIGSYGMILQNFGKSIQNTLALLANSRNKHERFIAAVNPFTPVLCLRKLAEDSDPDVLKGLASNGSLPLELFSKLADKRNKDIPEYNFIRYNLAYHPFTPLEVRLKLAADENEWVRECVASSIYTPIEIVHELVNDPSEPVKIKARCFLKTRERGGYIEQQEDPEEKKQETPEKEKDSEKRGNIYIADYEHINYDGKLSPGFKKILLRGEGIEVYVKGVRKPYNVRLNLYGGGEMCVKSDPRPQAEFVRQFINGKKFKAELRKTANAMNLKVKGLNC